ncbi:MAG: hypothetical protein U5N86_03065 [Planctomycetota bacterium]|nr:hypothetical protein [Planctomycetota bacterium]
MNFSYATDVRYKLENQKLLVDTGNGMEEARRSSLKLELEFPNGDKSRVSFEFFEPGDEEHVASAGDKLQYRIRNPQVLSFNVGSVNMLLIDSNVNGSFMDRGVDQFAQLSAKDFSKNEFDFSSLKLQPFRWWGEFEADKYTLFAPGKRGGLLKCELTAEDGYSPDIAEAICELNWQRFLVGAEAILPSTDLSNLLEKHAAYCAQEGLTREQDPEKYLYDRATASVAKYSHVCRARDAAKGIESSMSTLLGRNMLLSDELNTFGLALVNNIFVIGGIEKAWKDDFRQFPVNGQVDVPLRYVQEQPSALRKGQENYSGSVICFPADRNSVVESAVLAKYGEEGGKPLSVSTPSDPPHGMKDVAPNNRNAITLISEEPLMPGNTYRVTIKYKRSSAKDEVTELTWLFRTKEAAFR